MYEQTVPQTFELVDFSGRPMCIWYGGWAQQLADNDRDAECIPGDEIKQGWGKEVGKMPPPGPMRENSPPPKQSQKSGQFDLNGV